MPFFSLDNDFTRKKLRVFASEFQIQKMIDNGMEDFEVFRIGNDTSLLIPDTFWNRRKLKKLKIKFRS